MKVLIASLAILAIVTAAAHGTTPNVQPPKAPARIELATKGAVPEVPAIVQDPAPTPAQTTDLQAAIQRLGGTFVFDPTRHGRATMALTYRTTSLTDVGGRKGLNVDIDALVGASDGTVSLGTAALVSWEFKLDLANELKPVVALTVGPALLYGVDGGKTHLGAVVGVAFKF